MPRIKWPVALATAFVLLLGWYVIYARGVPVCTDLVSIGERFFKGPAGCVLIGNMGQLTGGIEMFPGAKPDDGKVWIAPELMIATVEQEPVLDPSQLPLMAPAGLQATDGVGGGAHLSWDAVDGASAYVVERSGSPTGPFATVSEAGPAPMRATRFPFFSAGACGISTSMRLPLTVWISASATPNSFTRRSSTLRATSSASTTRARGTMLSTPCP